MKLAIGLLLGNGFPVPVPFFLSYLELFKRLMAGVDNAWLPAHLQVESAQLIHSQDFPVDAARNDIVRSMLSTDASYLLFLDADMEHPADLPARLLRHDTAFITARYHMRRPPFHAVAMRYVGPNKFDCEAIRRGQGLMPIDFGGAGALLLRRDVLETIQKREGDEWFRYSRQTREPRELRISEDMHFYRLAREAGFQPFVDWDVECGHLAQHIVRGVHSEAYLDQIDAEVETRARINASIAKANSVAEIEAALKDTEPAIGGELPSAAELAASRRLQLDASTSTFERARILEEMRVAGEPIPSSLQFTAVRL